ncbi:HAD hydrolase-like protein, partial [Streptomyces sp. 150FB]|uniref:HAD hydrolase-like protein n=1 Tax=Streptomyces sp. 150FB TaxID=1576605 RepID=UPI001364D0AE
MRTSFVSAAVLFDMDGTLIDSAASIERVWTDFALSRGLPVAEVIAALPGRTARDILGGFLSSPEDVRAEAQRIRRAQCRSVGGVEPIPGARELVAALPPAGWAVVTSAPGEVAR